MIRTLTTPHVNFCTFEPGQDVHGVTPLVRLSYIVHEDRAIEVDSIVSVKSGTVGIYGVEAKLPDGPWKLFCLMELRKQLRRSEAFQAKLLSRCTADYLDRCAVSEARFCR